MGELSSHILRDSVQLKYKTINNLDEKEQKEIDKLFSDFIKLTEEYKDRVSAVNNIIDEVTIAFYKLPKNATSAEDRAESKMLQAKTLTNYFQMKTTKVS